MIRSLALGCAIACLAAAPAIAASVDAVVVKFRGGDLAAQDALPEDHRAAVAAALGTEVAELGRTRDGAFRLAIATPMPFQVAQSAINRLRLDARVLYAHPGRADEGRETRVPPKAGAVDPDLHRIIVKYRDAGSSSGSARDLPLAQGRLNRIAEIAGRPAARERAMAGGAHLIRMFSRMPRAALEAITDALERDPDVEWAQPDYLDRATLVPNDPLYTAQWHYWEPAGGVNLPAAWNRTTGAASIRIAVIDTGSLPNHPDLAGIFVGGYDMIADSLVANDNDPPCATHPASPCFDSRDGDASDPGDWVTATEANDVSGWFYQCPADTSSWHGTHVAGTIAARSGNGIGVAGVNWTSQVVPVRVLGKCGGYASDIADAIAWASGGDVPGVPPNANVAQVLNLSLGGRRSNARCDAVYQTAINGALSRNANVIVAAGNSNEEARFHTPGNCGGVITVAAVGRVGQRASYSNFDLNEPGVEVEIAAPGGSEGQSILSTLNNSSTFPNPAGYGYIGYQGTSMATPHVAGVVSLMLSVAPAKTPGQILAAIQTTARPFPTNTGRDCTSDIAAVLGTARYCGAGIIDADAAIGAVQNPPSTIALVTDPNPSQEGEPVRIGAAIVGVAPTGTVTFRVDGTIAAGCGAVPVTGTGNSRVAECIVTSLAPGSHFVDADYSGDAVNASSSAARIVHTVLSAALLAGQRDFDGNAHADLLWRTSVGGGHAVWLMSGTSAVAAARIGLDAPWRVLHTADFDGDGSHDLLVRDAQSGATAMWLMSGTTPAAQATLLVDPAWTVTHVADFDGDGRSDLVWRHAPTGTTAMWLMDGTTYKRGATLLVRPDWEILHTGDADGDGRDDLLWRNAGTGETALWLMNGTTMASGMVLLVSTAWAPAHVGDFNGDGRTDILWTNAASGETSLWLMNGLYMGGGSLLVANPDWAVTHVADLNGDGHADLLWRQASTGNVHAWLMSGGSYASGAAISNPGSSVVTTGDYDGNGRADVVWHNPSSGATEMRLMDGLAVAAAAVLLTSNDWQVQP